MSTPSSDADETQSPSPPNEEDVVSRWVVRIFLVLAFGLAFGIEGMTLVRSFMLEEETEQRAGGEEKDGTVKPLRTGDDLLPTSDVSERVAQMKIRARPEGPWVFRLVVAVANGSDSNYRLVVRDLETDDGTEFEEEYSVECPPDDSTRLVATWPVGPTARPHSLTAVAELRQSNDSIRTVRREVSFGHVPVQMER